MGSEAFKTDSEADVQEIYKGSYRYIHEKRNYSDERFSVYKNFDTQEITFVSEIVSRVANGEFLKINVIYTINLKHEPLNVIVEKFLGNHYSKETFTPDKNSHQLVYEFEGEGGKKSMRVQTPAKYHIATPAICTAMIFTKAKKYDPTILNSYYVISSDNVWEYQKSIESKLVYFRCDNIHVQEEVTINKKTLSGTKFDVFLEEKDNPDKITYFLSKHFAIPYQVKINRDTHVDIKELQNLQPSRMEDFLK